MRYLIPIITIFIIAIPFSQITTNPVRALEDNEQILKIDLEDNDGDLDHGGVRDLWEWGVPGSGTVENPGPDSSGSGEKCFGSPLNGTYREGTISFLEVPGVDVSEYRYLTLSYMIWFDLDHLEDERNGTGSGGSMDNLLVQVKNTNGNWVTVMNHTGSSEGDWLDPELDLSSFNVDELSVRFLLNDDEDGLVDNGVFIDEIIIGGSLRPVVEIEMYGQPIVAPFIPTIGLARVHYTILNEGRMTPSNSEVTLEILGPTGWGPLSTSNPISNSRISTEYFEWEPLVEGVYELFVNLTVEGNTESMFHFQVTALAPIFFDEVSSDLDHWTIDASNGDPSWLVDSAITDPPTISGGYFIRYGYDEETGENIGFSGETYSTLASSQIDLRFMDNAIMYIHHSYGFLGDQGTCGGLVQALDNSGQWVTLEPDQPHTRILSDGVSGRMSGEEAFQGDRDWYQIGFDLDLYIGEITTIRFVVSSGENGDGRGWLIDDIFVTGEGVDPFDSDPPEPVQGIKVEIIEDGWIEVEWNPSLASDLDHYNIYLGTGAEQLTRKNLAFRSDADNDTVISFKDLDPSPHWIAVVAVDRSGNEDISVNVIRFTPSLEPFNQEPVAKARIVGSNTGKIGDEFILNGSSSFDPDGDEIISYKWTMPDGSRIEGEQVRWKSTISGDQLKVYLTVEDDLGSTGTSNVTLMIKDKDNTDLQSEDLYSFIICMSPIIVSLIVIVIIVAWFRRSRQKKIRRELLRMGLDADPTHEHVKAEVIETGGKDQKLTGGKKIMDLVPVHTIQGERKKPVASTKNTGPRKAAPFKSVPTEEKVTIKVEKVPKEKEVTALVECPFCGNSFKASVNRKSLMSGDPFDIKCTHCGRSGQVG